MFKIYQNFGWGQGHPMDEPQAPVTCTPSQVNTEPGPDPVAELKHDTDTETENTHHNPSIASVHRLDLLPPELDNCTSHVDEVDEDNFHSSTHTDSLLTLATSYFIRTLFALAFGYGFGAVIRAFSSYAPPVIFTGIACTAIYWILNFICYQDLMISKRRTAGHDLIYHMCAFGRNPSHAEYRMIARKNHRLFNNEFIDWFAAVLSEYPQYYEGTCAENYAINHDRVLRYAAYTNAGETLPDDWTPEEALSFMYARYMVTRHRNHRFTDYRTNPKFTVPMRAQFASFDIYCDHIDTNHLPVNQDNLP